jgi:hypothetical protein
VDLALATRRAGDAAAARKLLAESGGLPASAPDARDDGWSAREQRRRAAERARVLGAL